MKNALYFFLLFLLMNSCMVNKKPDFVKVDNVEVVSVSSNEIRLKAAAFFENSNAVGGNISADAVEVIIDDVRVASVFVAEFKVPSKASFSVPLKAVIPIEKIFKNNKKGIFGGLFRSFFKKSIKVRFKGKLTYRVFGFSNVYSIDQVKEIKL